MAPRPRYRLTSACLRAIRREQEAGTTQQEIAAWMGTTPVTLSRWVQSRREDPIRPDDQRLVRLAAVLGLSVAACIEDVS